MAKHKFKSENGHACVVFGVILNELVHGGHGIESGVRKVFFADDNMAEQSELSRTRNTTSSSSSSSSSSSTTTTTTTTTTNNNNNS